jgi:hypothetical protein
MLGIHRSPFNRTEKAIYDRLTDPQTKNLAELQAVLSKSKHSRRAEDLMTDIARSAGTLSKKEKQQLAAMDPKERATHLLDRRMKAEQEISTLLVSVVSKRRPTPRSLATRLVFKKPVMTRGERALFDCLPDGKTKRFTELQVRLRREGRTAAVDRLATQVANEMGELTPDEKLMVGIMNPTDRKYFLLQKSTYAEEEASALLSQLIDVSSRSKLHQVADAIAYGARQMAKDIW